MLKQTLEDFMPEGVTGDGDEQDCFYACTVTGPEGAHYQLWRETHHTDQDILRAKLYLKSNFDPVSIIIIHEKV
jgi:hypothetical protein